MFISKQIVFLLVIKYPRAQKIDLQNDQIKNVSIILEKNYLHKHLNS